ncbi:DNA mismatch repair protein MutT, partial [bacterium (Candidatus Gribaldobacteria) CG07_land_8_20_14_0_80_33_18]
MKQATLCLLIKENSKEILLAMKKRGFGAGKWNGVGGKFDPEKDKNVLEAAIREAKEEIGVLIKDLEKVAVLDFYFPEVPEDFNWNQTVHVF